MKVGVGVGLVSLLITFSDTAVRCVLCCGVRKENRPRRARDRLGMFLVYS